MPNIKIIGAREGNLKDITLEIPKNKLVVFTGLSGSGKSTLLVDVLFNECQRQYLEALSMEGIHKPKVERIRGLSPAVLISQTAANNNPRSTVGTMTDIYTDLRMIYEKLGVRKCPHCGKVISAADCREETEKIDSDFHVYMYCSECGRKMDKLTRTQFSFNTREGACPACEGLGKIHEINQAYVANEQLSPEEGAISCWERRYGEYQTTVLYSAFQYYGVPVPPNTPIKDYSELQKAILYHGAGCEEVKQAFPGREVPKTVTEGKFEGVYPILLRRLSDKKGDMHRLAAYFETVECPKCHGERLGELSRKVTVHGTRLPELSSFSLEQISDWGRELGKSLKKEHFQLVEAYLRDIDTKTQRFLKVGLGYLFLDRQMMTLSGGESQRMRLAAVLDCDLTGMIYILDEPTIGLHPRDTQGMISILQSLRDLGNTVLVIEHDVDIMQAADYLIDIGPGSGKHGGKIVAAGTMDEIKAVNASVTGRYLKGSYPGKKAYRKGNGSYIRIHNANKFNLKSLDTDIPAGCLTTVTGPSGSGKSTLIFEVLAKGTMNSQDNQVQGLEQFGRIVEIEQAAITKMRRSNVATYTEVYSEIRDIFAKTEAAKKAGLTAKCFSFNTPGGRCENCQGLGYIESNMLFFTNIEISCPVCNGSRFHDDVLAVKYNGLSITEVLKLSVEEAALFLAEQPKVLRILRLLLDVGLGYLELGQTLTTLSGGEGQRLKLARELIGADGTAGKNLYLMDEPTTGLHPADVEHFLVLLNRMVEAGHTVVVVEHNQQIIRDSDWIIDLGPDGGEKGGKVVFTGTPQELSVSAESVTAKYL